MKKKIISIVISVIILAAIVILTIYLTKPKNPILSRMDEFAICISDKGAKMYGAYWCPHCINQKESFAGSWQHINYIECSLPNKQGQIDACKNAEIEGYPTWEFSDGSRVSGEMTFQELSEKTGCQI